MKRALAVASICALAACGAEQKIEAPPATPTAEPAPPPAPEPPPAPAPEPAPKSLYNRLNAEAGVTKLVDDALANIKADKRVAKYLPKDAKKLADLHDDLVAMVASASGGPASARQDPRATLKAMKLKAKDFDVIVEDITKVSLGEAEAKEVLAALSAMKDELTAGKK